MDSLYQILDQVKLYEQGSSKHDADLFWKELFAFHFLDERLDDKQQDDLLFFVYKIKKRSQCSRVNGFNGHQIPHIDVMRRFSPNLPLHLCSINWEETFFLNIILQKLEYFVFYSICTRTSAEQFQVISKKKLNVFATPSSHSVLFKESEEQYSYPFINFYIENFEELLYESIINEFEFVYLELLVRDTSIDEEPFVIFSSCINFSSFNEAYSDQNRIICSGQYLGIVQVQDHDTESTAEIVVKKKIKRSISDGSTFSNSMIDSFEESNKNGTDPYRLIKTSNRSKLYRIMRQGIPARTPGRCLTIESCDIFNDLDDPMTNLWSQKGFNQAYFEWRERQKNVSISFHCFVTNISLPWNHIINRLYSNKKQTSILFF